ncbi:M15 family metallopeptidase [Lysinibacillus xylanilyticus]
MGRCCWPSTIIIYVATLSLVGTIARKLGITWGGDWIGSIDRPHFEVKSN